MSARCPGSAVLATRLHRAALLLVGLATLAATGCQPRPERVVLLSIDTLRADHVGCYGARRAHTPTLDALAAEGVRFETAISPVPLTLPSHASLLTGLDPPAHGVRHNAGFQLAQEIPTLAERFREAGFATAAFVGAFVLDRQYGLDRGFDAYDDRMGPRHAGGRFGFPDRTADRVVDAALAWLETAPSRFLLWVHVYDPHADYQPPPGFRAAFPSHPYAAEIAFTDAELGRLLGFVERRWPDGRTLVVATSDHGESLGEHGEYTHSLTVYDATQRVPLLLRGPGVPTGRVVETPVGLADVAPTVLALAGLEPLPSTQGRDLRPTWRRSAAEQRLLYVETLAPQLYFGWSPLLGLRSQRFKYVRAPRPELYELATDPGELRNLASERSELVEELDRALEERLAATREPTPLAPDAQARGQLEALGYLATPAGDGVVRLGEVGGVDPKDALPEAQAMLVAMQRLTAGEPEEALALLKGLESGGYYLDLTRTEAALAVGDPVAAERYARAALAQAPQLYGPHVAVGQALLAQGRLEEAGRAFQAARRLSPGNGEPLVGLGRVAEEGGERERAAALYAEAAEQRSGSAEALWRLAALRLEAGAEDGARVLLARLPADALLEPEATARLARAEMRAGRREQAHQRLAEARERMPRSRVLREAWEALGSAP